MKMNPEINAAPTYVCGELWLWLLLPPPLLLSPLSLLLLLSA
jgi:hypothetical protein